MPDADLAYLSVMAGGYDSFSLPGYLEDDRKEGFMVPFAHAIKQALPGMPVIAAGRLQSPDTAEAVLRAGPADHASPAASCATAGSSSKNRRTALAGQRNDVSNSWGVWVDNHRLASTRTPRKPQLACKGGLGADRTMLDQNPDRAKMREDHHLRGGGTK